jgi:hypothetical protein
VRSAPLEDRDPIALFRLDGQTALITGASSGLGAHFTRTLHAAGATVVVAARRPVQLQETIAELDRGSAVPVDLALPEERERLVQEVLGRHGHVDILVNNAGITRPGPIENEALADFEAVMNLNVTATWHLAKLIGESMANAESGSIVNVASILGHVAAAPMSQANYAASKGAVVNLTRELAVQWARHGIRVNALCPGFFLSEMTAQLQDDPRLRAFVERTTPMGRIGALHELDGALLLLCSDAGRYITGTSLIVDGGWTAR